jgi:transcriptional regulator GlxA family with amidase domain
MNKYHRPMQAVNLVSRLLVEIGKTNDFSLSLETFAASHQISLRTLQRYFERYTGISSKKAVQIIRIRKALSHLIASPQDFHYSKYGYYDQSHFLKHLHSFSSRNTLGYALPTGVRKWINLHE